MANLQESTLGSVIDIITGIWSAVKDTKSDVDNKKVKSLVTKLAGGGGGAFRGSISSRANGLVMTFPVLMSTAISPDTALMVSKAIERKMVVMLQMLFASEIVAYDKEASMADVISRYYTNIDLDSFNVDDVMRLMDATPESFKSRIGWQEAVFQSQLNDLGKILNEASIAIMNQPVYEENIEESSISEYMIDGNGVYREALNEARNKNKNKNNKNNNGNNNINRNSNIQGDSMVFNLDPFDQDIINRLFADTGQPSPKATAGGALVDNDDLQDLLNAYNAAIKTQDRDNQKAWQDFQKKMQKKGYKIDKDRIQIDRDKLGLERDKYNLDMDRFGLEKDRFEITRAQFDLERDRYRHQIAADRTDFFKKQLLASDIKKANEMVPAMLAVDIHIQTNGDPIRGTGIIGVKTRMVGVDSFDIIDRIASKSESKANLFNLIRATTGETKMLKDFILNIDRAKVDAVARSKRGSSNPMWKVLERRANKQAIKRKMSKQNDASPITSLIMTVEEAEELKKMHHIDLNNPIIANDLLDSYNLMCLGIVDESAEVVKFLWDGEMPQFEALSFTALEKEDQNGAGMNKKIINLMADLRR